MDGYEKNEGIEKTEREEIFSKVVRAGKRTYFLDVKATRKNDYYLTITESKKRFNRDGSHFFEKHKIFLYKEDFDKFSEDFQEVITYIKNANKENEQHDNVESKLNEETTETVSAIKSETYTSDINFDDLNSNN